MTLEKTKNSEQCRARNWPRFHDAAVAGGSNGEAR
jgi:hypothetical protein